MSKDGEITRGRPLWAVGAHAEGSNRVSVGICFEGNFQLEEEMPVAQRQAGRALVAALRERYPAARVLGHRDVATGGTTCPGKYFPFEEIAGGQTESREGDEIMVTTQMIGSGDRGNAVKSMQGALIAQGYPCGSYGADGICGAATVSAIPRLSDGERSDGGRHLRAGHLGRAAAQVKIYTLICLKGHRPLGQHKTIGSSKDDPIALFYSA